MAELDRAAISVRIAEARDKRAGLTQPELADLLNVHWRTVQDWESPKNQTVPWDRLGEIADATGVTKEWLLHGEQEAPTRDVDLAALQEELAAVRGDLAGMQQDVRRLVELLEAPAAAAPEDQSLAG